MKGVFKFSNYNIPGRPLVVHCLGTRSSRRNKAWANYPCHGHTNQPRKNECIGMYRVKHANYLI